MSHCEILKRSVLSTMLSLGLMAISLLPAAAQQSTPQQATVIIHGTITQVQDIFGYYDSSVHVGTSYTAVFHISNVATISNFSGNTYVGESTLDGFTVSYGNYTTAPSPNFVGVSSNLSVDAAGTSLDLHSFSDASSASGPNDNIQAYLGGDSPGFSSDTLPLQGPIFSNINLFPTRSFTYYYQDLYNSLPNQFSGGFFGTIDSISSPDAVPEASTTVSFGLLLVLGMGGVLIAKKKKVRA